MPIEVKMAKLSPTMESGQMVRWLVKVGDPVKEGDMLAEVQTDKAVMPLESFDEGTVARLDVAEGDEIALGQRVLVLAKKGEDVKAIAASFEGGAKAAPAKTAEQPSAATAEAHAGSSNGQAASAVPAATSSASAGSSSSSSSTASASTSGDRSARVRSTPLARKIAAEAGLDLHDVPSSGPAGRVIRRDVESFLETRGPKNAGSPSKASSSPAPRSVVVAPAAGETKRIPLDRMRTAILKGMVAAKRNAPDIHLTVDIRVDQLVAVRERLNKQLAADKIKLSVGDFITKAVAVALGKHPAMNATFEGDNDQPAQAAIVRYGDVHVGLAVALDGGLIVPVLRHVDRMGLREIRVESEKLYEAARTMRLTPEQMQGGTFTISNLGMYGIRQFDAILNLPQVGILAVGSAEKRPIVENDALTIGTVMTVTLTADHRAVDGASAAEFLRTFKGLLEEPASMLL